MAAFDKEDIRLRLEAMKMVQSSLQQIMTLSAGALALYFSFIAKAPFISSRNDSQFWRVGFCGLWPCALRRSHIIYIHS